MAIYRTRPCEIEAIQWTDNTDEIKKFCGKKCKVIETWLGIDCLETLIILTLEGDMFAKRNDYIVKGLKGEFYPCKPDVFKMKYELVNMTDR